MHNIIIIFKVQVHLGKNSLKVHSYLSNNVINLKGKDIMGYVCKTAVMSMVIFSCSCIKIEAYINNQPVSAQCGV